MKIENDFSITLWFLWGTTHVTTHAVYGKELFYHLPQLVLKFCIYTFIWRKCVARVVPHKNLKVIATWLSTFLMIYVFSSKKTSKWICPEKLKATSLLAHDFYGVQLMLRPMLFIGKYHDRKKCYGTRIYVVFTFCYFASKNLWNEICMKIEKDFSINL